MLISTILQDKFKWILSLLLQYTADKTYEKNDRKGKI
jgi:hypothetical protein